MENYKLGRIKATDLNEAIDKIYSTVTDIVCIATIKEALVQPYVDEIWFEYCVKCEDEKQ